MISSKSDLELLISSEVDLEGFLLAAVVSSSVANFKGFESLAGSEPIFITDSTKNSYHVVVTVDKAHVNQTLTKLERSIFPLQDYQVPIDNAR